MPLAASLALKYGAERLYPPDAGTRYLANPYKEAPPASHDPRHSTDSDWSTVIQSD